MKVTKRNIVILTGNIIWIIFVFGSIYLFIDWGITGADAWVGDDQNRNPFGWVLFLGIPVFAVAVNFAADYYSKGFLYLLNKVLPE